MTARAADPAAVLALLLLDALAERSGGNEDLREMWRRDLDEELQQESRGAESRGEG